MTPQQVYRAFVHGYQYGHEDVVGDALLADDFVDHSPFPGFTPDKQGVLALFQTFWAAFPDLRPEILEQVCEGDMVATRKVFRGTHQGPLMGIPPTGRSVEILVFDMVRVRDGRIVEHWNVVDRAALMQQISAPAAA